MNAHSYFPVFPLQEWPRNLSTCRESPGIVRSLLRHRGFCSPRTWAGAGFANSLWVSQNFGLGCETGRSEIPLFTFLAGWLLCPYEAFSSDNSAQAIIYTRKRATLSLASSKIKSLFHNPCLDKNCRVSRDLEMLSVNERSVRTCV